MKHTLILILSLIFASCQEVKQEQEKTEEIATEPIKTPNKPSPLGRVWEGLTNLDTLTQLYGQTKTIVAVLTQVGYDKRTGTQFLNFGNPHPHQKLTIPIFKNENLPIEAKEGDTLKITGLIEEHEGIPNIKIEDITELKNISKY